MQTFRRLKELNKANFVAFTYKIKTPGWSNDSMVTPTRLKSRMNLITSIVPHIGVTCPEPTKQI